MIRYYLHKRDERGYWQPSINRAGNAIHIDVATTTDHEWLNEGMLSNYKWSVSNQGVMVANTGA